MRKEDREKEILKLELEKIRIEHATDIAYINQKNWIKITMIFGGLLTILNAIWKILPEQILIISILAVIGYVLILHSVADYALKTQFYGKPIKWYDKIIYYIFLDFIFRKYEEGINQKYKKKIENLKNKLK